MNQTRLTNVQLELLNMFSYDLDESQILEMKEVLAKHFAQKLTLEMGQLWEQNNWSQETMDNWAKEHIRIPYQDK